MSANMDEINTIIKNLGNISFDGQTVLVNGGAGFLGSWICDVLVELNADVICLDNFASGRKSNISRLLKKDNFTFFEHNITEPIYFDKKIDLVMHMASRASPFEFEKFPIQILKANTLGIWVALGIAKKHNSRFLYTSTSEIYGNPSLVPTPETYNGNVNPIGPRSCYDEAKRCGESYVFAYRTQHNLDTRIVRIFNTYGPKMRPDDIYGRVVPRFIEQALDESPITVFGDGTQTRSFCYVTDQIEGLLRFAYLDAGEGEVINIGNEDEAAIIDLAKKIKDLTNSISEITFHTLPEDDPKRRCPDIKKAKKILGWEPKISLEEGLRRMIKAMRYKVI